MKNIKFLFPLYLLFFIIGIANLIFWEQLAAKGISPNVVSTGNILLFALTMLTIVIQKKALSNTNPNVFLRSVLSGMLIKMVIAALIIISYSVLSGDKFSKAGVFTVMILYLIYLAVEVMIVMKLNRRKNG